MNKSPFAIPSRKQNIEFGQVAVLICIVLALFKKNIHFTQAAFWLMLIVISFPVILFPFAAIWYALSKMLSRISLFVLLNLIYFVLVLPVGMFRRLSGIDSMKLREFKRNRSSVMNERNHRYDSTDLQHTF